MKTLLAILVVIFLVAAGWYFFLSGKEGTPSLRLISTPSPKTVSLSLLQLGGSGESGTATLKEVGGKVEVTLELSGAPSGVSQPAHIHKGACPGVGEVLYPLSSPKDGKSETTLNTTLETLMGQLPLAINVHKSTAQSNIYVSCGDLSK